MKRGDSPTALLQTDIRHHLRARCALRGPQLVYTIRIDLASNTVLVLVYYGPPSSIRLRLQTENRTHLLLTKYFTYFRLRWRVKLVAGRI